VALNVSDSSRQDNVTFSGSLENSAWSRDAPIADHRVWQTKEMALIASVCSVR